MNIVVAALVTLVLGCATSAQAQSPASVPRIGFISALSASALPGRAQAFRKGLAELGYVEGKNIVVEYRWADGKLERISDLAAGLERLNVQVIVSAGPSATRRIRQATKTTPIVMAFDTDPVGSGFVDSFGRPGGRITGLSTLSPEISAKQVEILRQIVPSLSRLGVLADSAEPGNARALEETQRAARALGIDVQAFDIRASKRIDELFEAVARQSVHALIVLPSAAYTEARARVPAFAAKSQLPAIYWSGHFVDAGGLITYSVDIEDLYRRAATYVVRILKGSNPAEMPIEQPFKFEFVINMKAAREMGLSIPMSVLTRADRVIQ